MCHSIVLLSTLVVITAAKKTEIRSSWRTAPTRQNLASVNSCRVGAVRLDDLVSVSWAAVITTNVRSSTMLWRIYEMDICVHPEGRARRKNRASLGPRLVLVIDESATRRSN